MKTTQKMILPVATLCFLTVIIMILSLTLGHRQIQQRFTPPSFDATACLGKPIVPENLGWKLLDAQAYKVGICGTIIPKKNGADVWLTNPEENTVWLKVRILDSNGNILGESGLIKPGEYVQSVMLQTIPDSGIPIVLKIMAYEPQTYYSAGAVTLSTKIS